MSQLLSLFKITFNEALQARNLVSILGVDVPETNTICQYQGVSAKSNDSLKFIF